MNVNQFMIVVFNFGAGVIRNLNPSNANWFVRFLGWISPFRYLCEQQLRIMLTDVWYCNLLCEFYDYTFTYKWTVTISFCLMAGFFLMSWSALLVRDKF